MLNTVVGDGNSMVVNHYYHLCGIHNSYGLVAWLDTKW